MTAKQKDTMPLLEEADQSAVAKLLRLIRRDILAAPEDCFFGIHDDLEKRYNTSRPTLRQVMRVLEHEKLVTVKRGWAGGYYTRRPEHSDVVRAAALDLKLRHCTLDHALEAAGGVSRTIARLAAQSHDLVARAELAAALEAFERRAYTELSISDLLVEERHLTDAVSRLAGNPALTLFMSVLYELGWTHVDKQIFHNRPDRVEKRALAFARFVRAIVDGDGPIVDLLSIRGSKMFEQWLEEDRARPL